MPKRKSSNTAKSNGGGESFPISKSKKTTTKNQTESSASCADTDPQTSPDENSSPAFTFADPAETFAQLIHPITVETFFSKHWEKEPLLVANRNRHAEFFQSLFSRVILERLVAEKRVSFIEDCNVCRYKDGTRESLNGNGFVKPKQLKELFDKSKATVQFHQPQRFQDNIWQLLEHLESHFGCLVGSNVYMTPKDSQGLAPHYDDVEVFVLQLEGEKHWRLYTPPTLLPRDYSRDLQQSEIGTPIYDITLKAGDLLYFPRGTVHQADTPTTCSHSTHLTISTYQRSSWGDLLSLAMPSIVQTAILESKALRDGIPLRLICDGQASGSENTKKLKELIGQLGNHIGSHAQETANEMLCDFVANRLPPYSTSEADMSPNGPMPSLKHKVRIRFPDHTAIVRRRSDDDDDEEEEDDEMEEDDEEEEEEFQLFVYHSLQNTREEHMMSSEPKQPQGIQLPAECESALRSLQGSGRAWLRARDIQLQDDTKLQMLTSLWAEGLVEVADAS